VRPPTPAAGTATPANRSAVPAARAPAAPPAPHGATSWIQLGVFQVESRARGFADELARDGHAALVVPPAADGAGWRVLVGPFPSRPAADSAARLLGRPYFITGRGPGGAANE
jgi:cell division septation protein DedD